MTTDRPPLADTVRDALRAVLETLRDPRRAGVADVEERLDRLEKAIPALEGLLAELDAAGQEAGRLRTRLRRTRRIAWGALLLGGAALAVAAFR